jgi:hypothetical protein
VRAATGLAALLAAAGAAMAALAFAADGDGGDPAPARARGNAPPPASAAAATGRAVWVAQGCGSCHTFAPAGATGRIGPDLGATLRGAGAAYVRTSIVTPMAAAPPGWTPGLMPSDYASRMRPDELRRLVAFIAGNVR